MNEKQFDIIKNLAKIVWMYWYNWNYLKEKLQELDKIKYHKDNILSIVWVMDENNKSKLFWLWDSLWLDIRAIRSKVFYW